MNAAKPLKKLRFNMPQGVNGSRTNAHESTMGVPIPIRVQRQRVKGWKMPENTISVTRPGRYGNPFPIGEFGPMDRFAIDAEGAVGLFRAMLADPEMREAAGYPADLSPLRGKNLACFCPLNQPCHADVLLEIVNP
jgi:hypothetical protein